MNLPSDIPKWLESLGLSKLVPVFEEHEITSDVLITLTAEDLREMGVHALGQRKKILLAISRLSTELSVDEDLPVEVAQCKTEPEPVSPAPIHPARSAPLAPVSVVSPSPMAFSVPARNVSAVMKPSVPPGWKLRRRSFSGTFLIVSICVHLLLGVGAVYWVVQRIETKRKLQFASHPPSPAPHKRETEHKVSLQKKKNAGGAPPVARRMVAAGLTSRISLPEMPMVSVASSSPLAGGMGSMAGAGFGSGAGIGNGSGLGIGGIAGAGAGLPIFGTRDGVGLKGTFYDLKQTPLQQPTDVNAGNYTAFVRNWVRRGMNERDLAKYFKAPVALSTVQFMIPEISADEAPKAYGVERQVKPSQWVAVYRGMVQPPTTGAYRFVGIADDVLLVRVNGRLVFDGSYEDSSGLEPDEIIPPGYRGVGRGGYVVGKTVNFSATTWTPIEVVIGERPGGGFLAVLMVMKSGDDKNGDIPLFRVGTAQPSGAASSPFPRCKMDGPVWRVQSSRGAFTSSEP